MFTEEEEELVEFAVAPNSRIQGPFCDIADPTDESTDPQEPWNQPEQEDKSCRLWSATTCNNGDNKISLLQMENGNGVTEIVNILRNTYLRERLKV